MPLVKGPKAATKKGIAKNIRTESKTRPHKQAIAIALSLANKDRKHVSRRRGHK
jgi:galactose-1-phosphate uridylyltransferase